MYHPVASSSFIFQAILILEFDGNETERSTYLHRRVYVVASYIIPFPLNITDLHLFCNIFVVHPSTHSGSFSLYYIYILYHYFFFLCMTLSFPLSGHFWNFLHTPTDRRQMTFDPLGSALGFFPLGSFFSRPQLHLACSGDPVGSVSDCTKRFKNAFGSKWKLTDWSIQLSKITLRCCRKVQEQRTQITPQVKKPSGLNRCRKKTQNKTKQNKKRKT